MQPHEALVALVKDDSLKLTKNFGNEGSGLEAWRKLTCVYDPVDPLSNMRLLQKVQNTTQCTVTDNLLASLEN